MSEESILRLLDIVEQLIQENRTLISLLTHPHDFPAPAQAISSPGQDVITPGIKSWAQRRRDLEKRFEKQVDPVDWTAEADKAEKELTGVNIPEDKIG